MRRFSTSSTSGVLRRFLLFVIVAAVGYFAIQGGEYSTTALIKQRTRERMLRSAIDSLTRNVDSLRAYRRRLQNDPGLQERVAREQFGMVRGDKEILYRFIDTTRARP
jgi:cell division protein FtsB